MKTKRATGRVGAKSRRIDCLMYGCLSLVAAGLMFCAPAALARPHHFIRPGLFWTPAPAVNEGAPIPFSWRGSRLGRNHRLVVQRPVGTAHTWQTILRLSSNSGSGELPGMPLGQYRFRLADLSGHRVLAQKVAGVGVFGQVSLSTLFGGRGLSGVIATSQNSFPYVAYWEGEISDNPIFKVERNNCQSVHIAFVPTFPGPGTVGAITLVQESRDPISVSTARNTIGSLDAELVPGQSWAVNGQPPENIHLNGYAICDSTEPTAS